MSNNITFEEKSIDYEKSLDGDFKRIMGYFIQILSWHLVL